MLRKLLAFSCLAEIGTALAVLVVPGVVVRSLLGEDLAGLGIPLARCFGVALLALGLGCWPGAANVRGDTPAFRGMLVYNALIAVFLAYLSASEHLGGTLLWPAVVLHAVVAAWLVAARFAEPRV